MRIESTTVVMPRDIFEDRLMRSKSNRHKREDQICEGITIADLEEQRIRGGVRLGVERGRMPESSLMETTESLVEKLKLTTGGKLKNAAAAEPLVKAVYLLFLRHPEGITFKQLPDFRQELTQIYNDLRPTGLTEKALHSIEDVTNPMLNSINEKCARIRAAFLGKFDDYMAKSYYIDGVRGEAKKIVLPRNLVFWE